MTKALVLPQVIYSLNILIAKFSSKIFVVIYTFFSAFYVILVPSVLKIFNNNDVRPGISL